MWYRPRSIRILSVVTLRTFPASLAMQSPSVNFFVTTIFVFAAAYYVQAEIDSTITDTAVSNVDNNYLDEVEITTEGKAVISATFTVKKCVEDPLKLSCDLLSNGNPFNSNENTYKRPIGDLQDADMCGEFDPEPAQDSDCAIDGGTQAVKQCDLSGVSKQLPEGEFEIKCIAYVGTDPVAEFALTGVNKEE